VTDKTIRLLTAAAVFLVAAIARLTGLGVCQITF
jgi:hypothetical protein